MPIVEEIKKYIPLPVKMAPTAGIREIKWVGSVILVCACAILCLAVPTTCMLPYAAYSLLHAYNYVLPLWLIRIGASTLTTALDIERANWINPEPSDPLPMIRSGLTMRKLVLRMMGAVVVIMWASGDILNNFGQDVFHQVVKQIRSGKWGDLNPTPTEQQALEAMYGIINIAYVVARLALVFGIILATIAWINRANVADAQKDGEVVVTMSKGAGKDDEHIKMLGVSTGACLDSARTGTLKA